MEMLALAVVILVVVILYATNWLPVELTSILIPPVLVFTGILDLPKALSGFSSSATVAIGAMYILSAGLQRTGVIENITLALSRHSKGSPVRLLILLAVVIPLTSAFMNNTPVVVMMVPVVLAMSREFNVKPSRFMIPLSYFAILGGSCTLIGTSTNILVNEAYRQGTGGKAGFGMFEFAPMGLILVVAGGLFILIFGRKLLPDRSSLSSMLPRGRTAKFVTEIDIEEKSSLRDKRISDIFGKGDKVRLLEVVRDEAVVLAPHAQDLKLRSGDSLIIEGAAKDIAQFLAESGAALSTVVEDGERVPMRSMELSLGEAVVLPKSSFIGRTVGDLGLNQQFGVKVMAVQRRGRHHRYKIRKMYLQPGDVLLLQGTEQGFNALRHTEAVLVVEGLEQAIVYRRKAFAALGIMAAVIGLAAFTDIPIAMLAVCGAVLMIMTRCLRLDEAFSSLEPSVLLLLVGTIPLGAAMTETGLAKLVVDQAMSLMDNEMPVLIVSFMFTITMLLSQVLSNNATAALMAPIALGAAAGMGVDPKAFLMAVAFGASCSYMTPIGYQTNIIVMGPGGYQFRDYLRVGVPLSIISIVLATLFIPVFWPFQ
jgi:di/tricarboxylate transporter